MKYYKYRQKFSSGVGDWDYIVIPDWVTHKEVPTYLDDRNMLNNWSEHYRGVEWVRIKKMPRREIIREIKSAEGSIEWHQERVKILKEMLKSYPKIKGKVILTEWEDLRDAKKWKRWAVVTKGKRNPVKLYITKKYFYSRDPRRLALDWCEKNGYEVVETKYESIRTTNSK
jgi:hypothetical protein